MTLIIGLGNPGGGYARTRHNAGFMVVDAFASKFRIAITKHEKDAMTGSGRVSGAGVVVAKPQTFMNLSGDATAKLVRAYAESLDDVLVVYDDVDLPLGKIRIREGGSAGTHNGMRSIIGVLGSDRFPRLRFGVRGLSYDRQRDLADYVLEEFEPSEKDSVEQAISRATDALVLFVRGDLRRAMNTFNRDPAAEGEPEE